MVSHADTRAQRSTRFGCVELIVSTVLVSILWWCLGLLRPTIGWDEGGALFQVAVPGREQARTPRIDLSTIFLFLPASLIQFGI